MQLLLLYSAPSSIYSVKKAISSSCCTIYDLCAPWTLSSRNSLNAIDCVFFKIGFNNASNKVCRLLKSIMHSP